MFFCKGMLGHCENAHADNTRGDVFRGFTKAFKNFAKYIIAFIVAKFKYFAKQIIYLKSRDHPL